MKTRKMILLTQAEEDKGTKQETELQYRRLKVIWNLLMKTDDLKSIMKQWMS